MRRPTNSPVRYTRRRRVRNPWDIYDALPAPIRAVFWEGPTEFGVPAIAHQFRKLRREMGEEAAIAETIRKVEFHQRVDIFRGDPWQPPGTRRGHYVASPHCRADATMQLSRRGRS